MMYNDILHFWRGEVRLRLESPTPERILNLCAAHQIPFWDVKYLSPTILLLRTDRQGARRLRRVTGEIEITITPLGETGAPRLIQNFRRRYVLIGAAAMFLLLSWCGHTFIWDFEVRGNETVAEEDVLRALEHCGIGLGTRTRGIDQEYMRNHVLLELPDLSWLAVNVKGCTAHVQVVERKRPPKAVQDGDKTNVVAAKDGLVTKVQALDGERRVLPGTTVQKGQLLISGAVDHPDGTGVRFLHAQGGVWARTWYDLTVKVPLTVERKEEVRRLCTVWSVDFGKRHIKFGGKGSIVGAECDKMQVVKKISLPGGLRLPMTVRREKVYEYRTAPCQRSEAQALREGQSALLRQLKAQLCPDAAVESTLFSHRTEGDWLIITLSAECLEQIGIEIPIIASCKTSFYN